MLIAAAPGIGKSAFSLSYALQSGCTTFYQSCDSDAFTQLVRSVSIVMDWSLDEASKAVLANKLGRAEERLKGYPIRFNFRASPTLDDIEMSLAGYEEVFGEYPELIIIDNITNLRTDNDDGDPFSGLEALLDYMHDLARETQACVIGLHHVTGPYNDGDRPIPLSGLKNQVGRVPEMVLTLHRPYPDMLRVSTVKNRSGKADPSGNTYVELDFQGDHMAISDTKEGG